ncbi:diguanylate cyclase [Aliagarivorans marinus]|uniref:diguanylate cyclase n=1 Tax=Aliagarivorans marinus TaxID=561965 RepID=UPI0003FB11E4|nr:diguanylate cyclase [Aliagarivorans marinus]
MPATSAPIRQAHNQFLRLGGSITALVQAGFACLWWWLLTPSIDALLPSVWLIACLVLCIATSLHVRRHLEHHSITYLVQQRWYFVLSSCSGLLWGLGILLFAPALENEWKLVIVLLVGLMMGLLAIPNLLSIRSFSGTVLPSLIALAVMAASASPAVILAVVLVWLVFGMLILLLKRAKFWLGSSLDQHHRDRELLSELTSDHQAMRERSELDSLTQVYNRAKFEQMLEHYWRLASRASTSMSVLMIDVDFFKPYNDNYGHVAGDQCLRLVADTLRAALQREDDLLARYGGEEFVMILPTTSSKGAIQVSERIKQHMATASLRHEYSAVASHVTVSIGICCLTPSYHNSSIEILEKADQALYQAKLRGRNQAVIAARGEPL